MADQPLLPSATGSALPIGKCELCYKQFRAGRFALFSNNRRACKHLFCNNCRATMMGWPKGWFGAKCPNSGCDGKFQDMKEAADPCKSSPEDMFEFVNLSGKGKESDRITKEELADWFMANFELSHADAGRIIDDNWATWDVPQRQFIAGLIPWGCDRGNLDREEFVKTHDFMKKAYEGSLAMAAATATALAAPPASSAPSIPSVAELQHGRKRNREADEFLEGFQRNVQQRKASASADLQRKLRDDASKGRAWFDEFDHDRSGNLERAELTTALLQTFIGSHNMTRPVITEIVDGVWDAIDTNGSGAVCFEEFQMLREALVAQMNRDLVNNAVSRIA